MTTSHRTAASPQWKTVDDGWGHAALDFAVLSEPSNVREYVSVHHQLGVRDGDRLLDIACGSGLALELAGLRGAECAGIDAAGRLMAVAQDRCPDADLRVGDMGALPWAAGSFTKVTSFRGIWGTTIAALDEAWRVLEPGGWIAITVWGHIKASAGAWALAPFRLAAPEKVANQAQMVALGRPGVGEAAFERAGFVEFTRQSVPFVWEFADPEMFARALASTGPAYEAIVNVGADRFRDAAVAAAAEHQRAGLPLRASIDVVAYFARKPGAHS